MYVKLVSSRRKSMPRPRWWRSSTADCSKICPCAQRRRINKHISQESCNIWIYLSRPGTTQDVSWNFRLRLPYLHHHSHHERKGAHHWMKIHAGPLELGPDSRSWYQVTSKLELTNWTPVGHSVDLHNQDSSFDLLTNRRILKVTLDFIQHCLILVDGGYFEQRGQLGTPI